MPTITLSVNDELKKDMDQIRDINWSEVARAAIKIKVEQMKILNKIISKSRFTEKDALEMGRKINKAIHNRYYKNEDSN